MGSILQSAFYINLLYIHRNRLFWIFYYNFKPNKKSVVLDVGGVSEGFEQLSRYCECVSINLEKRCKKNDAWNFIVADARFVPIKTGGVNFAISNSVIEHVTEGTTEFSRELQRVAKDGYFVSCPYYFTLLEPHYFVPLFQFIPEAIKRFLIFKVGLHIGHLSKNNYLEIKLIRTKHLKVLFKGADVRIYSLLGLPMEVILTKKFVSRKIRSK